VKRRTFLTAASVSSMLASAQTDSSSAVTPSTDLVEFAGNKIFFRRYRDFGPLGIWRQWAPHAQGQAMKGGHFFPEENPDDTAALVKEFLAA
jgi:hypothetical protein